MSKIISFVKSALTASCLHIKRSTVWRLLDIEPSVSEEEKLNDKGIDKFPVMRSYLVWRRSSMMMSLPIILCSTIIGFSEVNRFRQDQVEGYYDHMTALGKCAIVLPSFSELVLFIAAICALTMWPKWRTTSRLLLIGWIISTVMPLIPALIPLEHVISEEFEKNEISICLDQYDSDDFYTKGLDATGCKKEYDDSLIIIRMGQAGMYGMQILPLILTFPSSVTRGALRIRGLLPDSSLASWVIMISAPFYSLLILISLVFAVQLAGSFVLVTGTLLLCSSPWLFVLFRGLYVGVSNDENEKKIDRNHRIMLVINIVGILLLAIWALPQKSLGYNLVGENEEDSILTYRSFFQILFEGVGRLLVTTVVFSDALLNMTITNWQHENSRRQNETTCEHIKEFSRLFENAARTPPLTPESSQDESDIEDGTMNESNDEFDKEELS